MSQLFFTKTSALRILQAQGIPAKLVEVIRVYRGCIQLTYRTSHGRCSAFISKRRFYNDFVSFRQERAKTCTVRRWGAGSYQCRYEVFSSKTERIYTVELSAGIAMCGCVDWERQRAELGKAAVGCKHILATIGTLGHSSLTDYLLFQEAEKARIIAEAEEAKRSLFSTY